MSSAAKSVDHRSYLGDGVYADFDGYHVILAVPGTAHESGRDQRIALEPGVLGSLNNYVKQLRERYESASND